MTKQHVICLASYSLWNEKIISTQGSRIFPLLWPFRLSYVNWYKYMKPERNAIKIIYEKVPKNKQTSDLVTLERKEDSVQDFQNFLRLEYFFSSNFTIVVSELKMSNYSKLHCNKTTIITWCYSTHLKFSTFGKSNRFVCFDYVRDTFDAHWKHSMTCC